MFAFRAWTLIGVNLLTAYAAPISVEDVQAERQQVTAAICLEKTRVIHEMAFYGSLLKRAVVQGISVVQNKLESLDLAIRIPSRAVTTDPLADKPNLSVHAAPARSYTTHSPSNQLKSYLNPKQLSHPEDFVLIADLPAGFNILTPLDPTQAPACLSSQELESYIHVRLDLKIEPGAYWRLLHTSSVTEEQLALLRYYDYLDTNAPKQPVTVYRCTEFAPR